MEVSLLVRNGSQLRIARWIARERKKGCGGRTAYSVQADHSEEILVLVPLSSVVPSSVPAVPAIPAIPGVSIIPFLFPLLLFVSIISI